MQTGGEVLHRRDVCVCVRARARAPGIELPRRDLPPDASSVTNYPANEARARATRYLAAAAGPAGLINYNNVVNFTRPSRNVTDRIARRPLPRTALPARSHYSFEGEDSQGGFPERNRDSDERFDLC